MEKKVMTRIGIGDIIVSSETAEKIKGKWHYVTLNGDVTVELELYHVGYETEDGEECDENGNVENKLPF